MIVKMYKYNKLMTSSDVLTYMLPFVPPHASGSESPHFLPSGFRPAALASLGPSLERLVALPFSDDH